jgi:P-type E1-E2 ATPase
MIVFDIPGRDCCEIRHLVVDYNGTLALDGALLSGVEQRLQVLSSHLSIHVLTADTFGCAASQIEGLALSLAVIPDENQDIHKKNYVEVLGSSVCVCIGNGRNDALMLEAAAIGIAVVQQECAAAAALRSADIIAPDIVSALDLLLNPLRLKATLRR